MKRILLFSVWFASFATQAQQTQIEITGVKDQGVAEVSPTANNTPLASPKALWDVQFSANATAAAGSSGQAGIAFINNEFWTSRWANDTLYRYSSTGSFISSFTISGLSGTRSITSDGTNVYIGNASTTIYVVNPGTQTVSSTITSSAGVNSRFLTYDATLNGGNGGFWTGDFNTDIVAISMTGSMLTSIPAATHGLGSMYGAAVDVNASVGPILWVFHQEGANSTQMTALALPSGTNTGVTRDVYSDVSGTYSLTSGLSGGAFISTDYSPGTTSLIGMVQGTPSNVIVVYDGQYVSLEEESINNLSVYPVPANDHVTVDLRNALPQSGVAQLFDMGGRLISEQELASGTLSFDVQLDGIDGGVYQLVVNSNGLKFEERVIVE